jgi:hypothetical protein
MATNPRKIRVGILCNGLEFESWEAEAIRQVKSLPFVELVVIIRDASPTETSVSLPRKLLQYPWRKLNWRLYKRFRLHIPATSSEHMADALAKIPLLHCIPELRGKYSQHFSAADIEKVRAYQPDVLLRFGFNILRGEILHLPQYGIWSFHHADEQIIRGGPAAFWEIRKGYPVTGAILQRLTEKLDAGIVLRKGWFPTISHSHKANLQQLLHGTSSWMKQALIDLYNEKSPASTGVPLTTKAPVLTYPNNWDFRCFRWIQFKNKFIFHWNSFFKPETWRIGIVRQPIAELISKTIYSNPEWIQASKSNEYLADPFGWKEENVLQIVAEHYSYKTGKGHIAKIKNGIPQPLIQKKEHLSYPFVLPNEKRIFIFPECFESNRLRRFSSSDFQTENILLENFGAVDPSLVFWNNRWWLFCTEGGDYANTALFIFHCEKLDGTWRAHANNPVKWDIASARPGGTPFILNGTVYRPAQDCSMGYGSAIAIQEIIELTETSFVEKTINRISPEPNWKYRDGLHTLSIIDENCFLIDAKSYRFNFDNFTAQLKKKFRRLFSI